MRVTRTDMTRYSLLFINGDDHIVRSQQIDCSSDEQVMETARFAIIGDRQFVQIWAGKRLVSSF